MFPARNGRWYYVHANFPHHRAAALKVLRVSEDRDAVVKAIAQWDALELEEAILAADNPARPVLVWRGGSVHRSEAIRVYSGANRH